jgi:hypothetical protein
MGTVTVTRSPPPETLLSDRDQKNVPPQPPLVVGPDVPNVAERVIARWRGARLPALDEHRAHVVIGRRVADGMDVEELLDAVDGAPARTSSEGWQGVCSAFAVVMASAADMQAYARRGREARSARERVQAAEREVRARDSANERVAISMRGALARTSAAAAAGHYEVAARLARELELAAPNDRTKERTVSQEDGRELRPYGLARPALTSNLSERLARVSDDRHAKSAERPPRVGSRREEEAPAIRERPRRS